MMLEPITRDSASQSSACSPTTDPITETEPSNEPSPNKTSNSASSGPANQQKSRTLHPDRAREWAYARTCQTSLERNEQLDPTYRAIA